MRYEYEKATVPINSRTLKNCDGASVGGLRWDGRLPNELGSRRPGRRQRADAAQRAAHPRRAEEHDRLRAPRIESLRPFQDVADMQQRINALAKGPREWLGPKHLPYLYRNAWNTCVTRGLQKREFEGGSLILRAGLVVRVRLPLKKCTDYKLPAPPPFPQITLMHWLMY